MIPWPTTEQEPLLRWTRPTSSHALLCANQFLECLPPSAKPRQTAGQERVHPVSGKPKPPEPEFQTRRTKTRRLLSARRRRLPRPRLDGTRRHNLVLGRLTPRVRPTAPTHLGLDNSGPAQWLHLGGPHPAIHPTLQPGQHQDHGLPRHYWQPNRPNRPNHRRLRSPTDEWSGASTIDEELTQTI